MNVRVCQLNVGQTLWLGLIKLIGLALNKGCELAPCPARLQRILSENVARRRRVDPSMHAMIDLTSTIETFLRQSYILIGRAWKNICKYLNNQNE